MYKEQSWEGGGWNELSVWWKLDSRVAITHKGWFPGETNL